MQGALPAGCGCDVVAKVKLKERTGRLNGQFCEERPRSAAESVN